MRNNTEPAGLLSSWRRIAAAVALCLCLSVLVPCGSAQAPQITKVEPPNWWIGLQPDLMLLISGQGLANAQVTAEYPGVSVARTQAQSGGQYLFVWLQVEAGAKPGNVPLRVRTTQGTTQVMLPLLPRNGSQGQFQGLSSDDVIYLIMPDRFCDGNPGNNEPAPEGKSFDRAQPRAWHGGDLKGIRSQLPYLKSLGITNLWLTPFWKNDWRADDRSYHGYHVVDFYAVDEHLGGMRDLQALVQEAHRSGIKFTIDFVANHVGPHHPWAAAPPTATWLHGTPEKHPSPAYDFSPLLDPHAPPAMSRRLLEGWFAEKLPDLNVDDPLLARYLLQNAEWWLESTGADVLRLDTFPYSSRKFWSGWHEGLFKAYPTVTTIGEVWNVDPTITSFFAGGRKQFDSIDTGLSTVFDFPMFDAVRDVVFRDASARRIAGILQHDSLYPAPERLVTFIGNHDTRRMMGETGATRDKVKAAFALLLTLRGIPQIYSGDEIGMPGGDDPDNRRDFPGGFPGDSHKAFVPEGRTADEQDLFSHVQMLIRLRAEHPALRSGKLWHLNVAEKSYVFLREKGEDRLLVALNNSDEPTTLSVDLADSPLADAKEMWPAVGTGTGTVAGGTAEIYLRPRGVTVFVVR